MSHSSINDKLRQLASDIQAGVDNYGMTALLMDKPVGSHSVTKHTGWIVLQRIPRKDGGEFIAPSFWETNESADLFASAFDNVVAIMPIEWEE